MFREKINREQIIKTCNKPGLCVPHISNSSNATETNMHCKAYNKTDHSNSYSEFQGHCACPTRNLSFHDLQIITSIVNIVKLLPINF